MELPVISCMLVNSKLSLHSALPVHNHNRTAVECKMNLLEDIEYYRNATITSGVWSAFAWDRRDIEADDLPMMNSIAWPLGEFLQKLNTDFPAYSDTVYSDTPFTVTLLACPK